MAVRTDSHGLSKLLIRFGLASLFLSHALTAQAVPPPASEPLVSTEKTIVLPTKALDLKQWTSPKTSQELLRLLRFISENFLLLDPNFHNNEMLLTLFGPGEMYDPYAAYPQLQGIINKSITLESSSLIREHLKIDGFAFGLIRYFDQLPVKKGGSLGFITSTPENPFLAELMETNFGVGTKWYDPLGGFNAVATHENIDAAFRRPIKTHPKGYLRIDEIHENERFISKLQIELNQNGTLRSARMNQKEK